MVDDWKAWRERNREMLQTAQSQSSEPIGISNASQLEQESMEEIQEWIEEVLEEKEEVLA